MYDFKSWLLIPLDNLSALVMGFGIQSTIKLYFYHESQEEVGSFLKVSIISINFQPSMRTVGIKEFEKWFLHSVRLSCY